MHVKVAIAQCLRRKKELSVADRCFIEEAVSFPKVLLYEHIGRVIQIHSDLMNGGA
jgi:hypothetical protein